MHPPSKNSGFQSVVVPHGNFLVTLLYPEISESPVPGVLVFGNRKSLFPVFVFSPCGFSNPASNSKMKIGALAMKKTKPNQTTNFLIATECVIGVVWWQYCYFLFGGGLAHVDSIGIIAICHGAERPKKLIMLKCSKKRFRTWPWEHYNPTQAQCDLKAHCSISVISSLFLETFSVLQTKVYFLFRIRLYDVWKKYFFTWAYSAN